MNTTDHDLRDPLPHTPDHPLLEEAFVKPLLRGWFHVVGFLTGLALGVVLIAQAPNRSARIALVVYIIGLCTMLGVSALYHRGRWNERQLAFMRKLDHSTIFLAIAGSYTPIAWFHLAGWQRAAVLSLVWGGSVLGIALQWTNRDIPRWAFTAVYAVVGWVALIAIAALWNSMGVLGFSGMIGGGLGYTIGAVVYALKKPDPWPRVFGYHEVFHLCTLIGAGLHLATIAFVVMPHAQGS
jgi:hemolysin III